MTSASPDHPAAGLEQTDFPALARHLALTLVEPLGDRAWLVRRTGGGLAVLKTGPGAGPEAVDFLGNLARLFPPFAHPRILQARPGFYVLYEFIPGTPLSQVAFESEAHLEAAFELSGRLTALFRSLKLVPMVRGMQGQNRAAGEPPPSRLQHLAALQAGLGQTQDGLAVRRWEASRSYSWSQEVVSWCADHWPAMDAAFTPPWEALRERVEHVTSIHLTVSGSSLAHTAFTPEHLLATPDGTWAVVGWQVAPRPYNYMRYRYLAWCLVHSCHGDLMGRYRGFLSRLPAIAAAGAHPLTFALTLLETWVTARTAVSRRQEKLQVILTFVSEALTLPVAAASPSPEDPFLGP